MTMMPVKPWTKAELEEIARLRKEGKSDSEIRGWMKSGNNRGGYCPPLDKRSRPMATGKKAGKKKGKKAAKTAKKKAGRKTGKKPGRKPGGFQVGETLTAVKGKDDSFYQKFPRYAAYKMLCKKGSMATSAFVDAVEKMKDVKSRAQALGILTKLLDKGCAKASGATKKA